MLPCVSSVIDHMWRQNVVKTKAWHTGRYPSESLMFLPHFDVFCDLLLSRCTATWNLFVLYNNETNYNRYSFFYYYFKILQHRAWAGLCPLWRTRKRGTWRNLLSKQNDTIPSITMRSKGHSSWNENLQRKQNSTAKSAPERKCWKNEIRFCNQSSSVCWKVWTLLWILRGVEKNTLGKLAVAVNLWGLLNRVEWKGLKIKILKILVFCGRGFANQFDTSLADTF